MSPLTEPTKLTLAKGQPVPNDPYLFTNTVLLLHGDGANGSTNIVDSSRVAGSPKIVTPVGNAQISTAIADPFGNSTRGVLAFDGTGDYLSLPSDPAFSFSGDATIECWFRSSTSSAQYIYDQTGSSKLVIYITTGGVIGVQTGVSYRETGSAWSTNTWHHLAITKLGNVYTTFLDGTQRSYSSSSGVMLSDVSSTSSTVIGAAALNGGSAFNGYIDDLRITKGVARYTSNFTPPTAPFPDF